MGSRQAILGGLLVSVSCWCNTSATSSFSNSHTFLSDLQVCKSEQDLTFFSSETWKWSLRENNSYIKPILKCLLNLFVCRWMYAHAHFSHSKFKVDDIFLPEELSASMENKYCKESLSKVSAIGKRWFLLIVYLFVVNICLVQSMGMI